MAHDPRYAVQWRLGLTSPRTLVVVKMVGQKPVVYFIQVKNAKPGNEVEC